MAGHRMISGRLRRQRHDQRPVDHRRRYHARPVQAELAFDHAPRRVDAVDIDRHAGLAGNDDFRRALRNCGRSRDRKRKDRRDKTHD